jgi:predicted DNA-binding transcriptional regulator AlpA
MPVLSETRMLRVAEAANLIGLSVSFLNKLRVTGDGPIYRKIGRAVLYHPDDLETWLSNRRRTSTSDATEERIEGARRGQGGKNLATREVVR